MIIYFIPLNDEGKKDRTNARIMQQPPRIGETVQIHANPTIQYTVKNVIYSLDECDSFHSLEFQAATVDSAIVLLKHVKTLTGKKEKASSN